jgi:D-glycero-alpha-D-manno-heptose-7-phosphate kinase
MIVTRSPLRISLGGGGTDLPSYYQEHGGFLIAAAINQYVYITIHEIFAEDLIIKYSEMERVSSIHEVQHPIIREALKALNIQENKPSLEISSMADIHAGTGLGSSGAFTVALLKALHKYQKNLVSPEDLARQACDIEINKLKEPVGKQDQYISAYGGLTAFEFGPDDQVRARKLNISNETLYNLEDNLMLFFTGFFRSASKILKDQDDQSKKKNDEMIQNLHYVKEMGYRSAELLERGDLHNYALLMHEHWMHKKRRSQGMSNSDIDKWYALGLESGALGGKVIGAGGGGFLMFYTEDKRRLRRAMTDQGLREVRFRFDHEGAKVIVA